MLSEEGLFHEPPPVPEAGSEVDWSEVRCGDTVYLPELQADARVLSLPDRKGTVVVEAKGFRMQVEADRVWKPALQKRTIRKEDTGRLRRNRPPGVSRPRRTRLQRGPIVVI